MQKLQTRLKSTKEERKILADEEAQCKEQRNQLELVIKDLEDDVDRERTGRVIFLIY